MMDKNTNELYTGIRNMSEYLPDRKTLWLVFDLANGHKPSHRYVWWFDRKKDALEHIRFQKTRKNGAPLSDPIKVMVLPNKPKK